MVMVMSALARIRAYIPAFISTTIVFSIVVWSVILYSIPGKAIVQDIEHAAEECQAVELSHSVECVHVKLQKLAELVVQEGVQHFFSLFTTLVISVLSFMWLSASIHLVTGTWQLVPHLSKEDPPIPASLKMRLLHSFLQNTLYSPLDIICYWNTGRRLADVITGYDMVHA